MFDNIVTKVKETAAVVLYQLKQHKWWFIGGIVLGLFICTINPI